MTPKQITPQMLSVIASRFQALGDPTRLRLLMRLKQGPASVGELIAETDVTRSAVSRHLGVLRQAGLIEAEWRGATALYSIRDPQVFDLCSIMCEGVHRYHKELADALGAMPGPESDHQEERIHP